MAKLKYNWDEIQTFYNTGKTWRDIKKQFGPSNATIHKAIKANRLKLRPQAESLLIHHTKYGAPKHTSETKKKISDARIKFLTENPDKVPYLINHSSNKSWPEEVFENALVSSGIKNWIRKYRNGIYQYDFAFLDKKIDVEIDGGTHQLEKVKAIDKRRDEFSKNQGWTVIRFTAIQVKKDVISCINELKKIL